MPKRDMIVTALGTEVAVRKLRPGGGVLPKQYRQMEIAEQGHQSDRNFYSGV